MTTASLFLKIISIPDEELFFFNRTSDAPHLTLSELYDVPVDFVSPSFEALNCYISDRKRVAVARYR